MLVAAATMVDGSETGGTAAGPESLRGTLVFACSGCPMKPGGPALYFVAASGGDLRRHPTTLTPYSPRWSPMGRHVAIMHRFSRIAVLPVPGGSGRLLTNPCNECAQDPAWSPDGRRIAYMNRGRLFTMRSNGTRERLLLARPKRSLSAPDWSPDGQQIAFDDRGQELYVVRSDGTRVRRLGRVKGRYPRWSPSGRWIAFVGFTRRGAALMIVRSDGTHPRFLVSGLPIDINSSPSWSPDGRHVAFTLVRENEDYDGHQLMAAALDGSPPQPVVIPELPPTAYSELYGVDWTSRALSS
jgi:TolB protein